ncbi:MAG: AAA family ATPase, partial [Rhodoferax sp.]|nr:AAA family ATPase [Rhodoferax sp.]
MKILAIRGKNLASLSAEFAIDFQSEPLASAGLYAITGPTGSGKSTLLDALCLALYERTPRLSKATTARGETIPDVGDNTVAPGDPRTLLRRGAGEGFAEVDFVGSDAVAYRARWSVRRSHQKASGALQKSEVTLTRIVDNQRLGDHTKTETLRRIEACIGLSFEQFTRAVLLAQNDFATFLKAPDDERAELLQTLTGTETFAELSRQAFARMKAEKETLDRLQAQLNDQLPLQPPARADKDAALLAQEATAAQLAAHTAGIEEQQRWYQQWEQRQAERLDASTRLEAAITASKESAPRHAHLQFLEQVQTARPLRSEFDRLSQAASLAAQAELDASAALLLAQQQAMEREGMHAAARDQLAAADAEKAQAQPAIDQARALDASIATLEPRLRLAQQAQAEAQAQRDAALAAQAQTAMQIEETQAAMRSAESWLTDNATLRPLAEGWQLWETLLGQALVHLMGQTQAEAGLEDLAQQATDNTQKTATAQATLEQATQHATASAEKLHAVATLCAATDAEQLARDKQAQEDRRDQLQAAAQLWQRRCELRAQRKQLQEQQQAETTVLQASAAELQLCAQQLPLREAEWQAAEQALQRAQLAVSEGAETLRNALQPEQPCPVCGALEHPYASHAPVVDAMLQSLQAHVDERRQALRDLQDASVRAHTNQTSASKALAQLGREQTTLEARHAALLGEWTALALHGAIEAVPLADRDAWLLQGQHAARASLQALGRQEEQLRSNLKLRDAAQGEVNAANQSLEQARETVNKLLSNTAALAQATHTAQRQRDERAQQLEQVLSQLDQPFAGPAWRQRWHADAQAFVAQCRSDASAWTQQQESRSALASRIERLQVEWAAADAASKRAEQQLLAQTSACQTETEHLNGLRQQRQALLQGRAVADAEQALHAAIQQGRATLEATQASLQQARDAVHRLQ